MAAGAGDPDPEPVIGGPYSLYHGSFILEFLKPKPSRNASSVCLPLPPNPSKLDISQSLTRTHPHSPFVSSVDTFVANYTSYSVLMRATYKHDHPMCKLGKGHSQVRHIPSTTLSSSSLPRPVNSHTISWLQARAHKRTHLFHLLTHS